MLFKVTRTSEDGLSQCEWAFGWCFTHNDAVIDVRLESYTRSTKATKRCRKFNVVEGYERMRYSTGSNFGMPAGKVCIPPDVLDEVTAAIRSCRIDVCVDDISIDQKGRHVSTRRITAQQAEQALPPTNDA